MVAHPFSLQAGFGTGSDDAHTTALYGVHATAAFTATSLPLDRPYEGPTAAGAFAFNDDAISDACRMQLAEAMTLARAQAADEL